MLWTGRRSRLAGTRPVDPCLHIMQNCAIAAIAAIGGVVGVVGVVGSRGHVVAKLTVWQHLLDVRRIHGAENSGLPEISFTLS